MNSKEKNSKGITLIALVITIIILLILAAITITSLTQTGMFQKAQDAKDESYKASAQEDVNLATMALGAEDFTGSMTQEEKRTFLENEIKKYKEDSTVQISGNGFIIFHKGFEFNVDSDGKVLDIAKIFDKEEWDKKAVPDEYLLWQSDDPNNEGYGVLVGFKKNIDNYPKLRIPSRCTKISMYGKEEILKHVQLEEGQDHEFIRAFTSNVFEVQLPETVTEISEKSFSYVNYYWSNLEKINIPSKVKVIESYTIEGLDNLNTIIIENGVEEIKEYAFGSYYYGQDIIINITIPESVSYIGRNAFNKSFKVINIKKPQNSISGANWGANNATINWNYKEVDNSNDKVEEFDSEKWDKKAAPEDIFIWETDYIESSRYGVLIGFKENVQNYPTLRIPSRCTEIKFNLFLNPKVDEELKREGQYTDNFRSFTSNVVEIQLPKTIKKINSEGFYNEIFKWNSLEKISIVGSSYSISGANWKAPSTVTVNWNYTGE